MTQITEVSLGSYQLPKSLRDYKIKVVDSANDKVSIFSTNASCLTEYSDFFMKYFEFPSGDDSNHEKEVTLKEEVCSADSVFGILQWIHSIVQSRKMSKYKIANMDFPREKQKEDLTEILDQNYIEKDFSLFELFQTVEFFALK